ncbi:MAG: DUF4253 domain-containing protein [Candidatus Obscuribacter sp.]|nr:DUF4253 domain-containing protein [Candidatus Obscuribacter sp.]
MLSLARAILDECATNYQGLLEVMLPQERTMAVFTLDGAQAEAAWQRLAVEGSKKGLKPLLLGTPESFELHMETLGMALEEPHAQESPAEWLRQAGAIDLDDWIAGRLEDHVFEPGQWPEQGERPAAAPIPNILSRQDFVYGALLDITDISHIPAWLNFGSAGACPAVPIHTAFLNRWRHFQIDCLCLSEECFLVNVGNPPAASARESCLKLAREHFAYCPEILSLHQDKQLSLSQYAAALADRRQWLFSWS